MAGEPFADLGFALGDALAGLSLPRQGQCRLLTLAMLPVRRLGSAGRAHEWPASRSRRASA